MTAEKNIFKMLAELENLISDIYMQFSTMFPEDKDFWWKLSMEERIHSSIAENGRDEFMKNKIIPKELSMLPLSKIEESIAHKKQVIAELNSKSPLYTRKKAFETGIYIESQDIEELYEELMRKLASNAPDRIFQKLNKDSNQHAARIASYMEAQNII